MPTLKEKFRGCIAGSWIGSAMGAVVEGWPREKVVETFGRLEELKPYSHYIEYTDWQRPAGTTEDGIERQKLIATAIIEKRDRINLQDLAGIWRRDLDPRKVHFKQEPFDRSLAEMLLAGTPVLELGRMFPFVNVISVARVSHPLGLINAGDPRSAADDSFEIGKLYMKENDFGLRWAALYNAGIAAACLPGATVDSVAGTIIEYAEYRAEPGRLYKGEPRGLKFSYDQVAVQVNRAFEIGRTSKSLEEVQRRFDEIYFGGFYQTYGLSTAHEIVGKGLALFAFLDGDPRQAVVAACNFGRDTDCLAAIAGGLSGALRGPSIFPEEWIAQVNEATRADPYTNNHRTIEETADGLYAAFEAKQLRLADYVGLMPGGS
jgi:ADP-ribosylglycohydrolase